MINKIIHRKPIIQLKKQIRFLKNLNKGYTWDNINIVFIISTGRTGTHFFSNFFNRAVTGVYALHEPPHVDFLDLGKAYLSKKISSRKAMSQVNLDRSGICADIHEHNCDVYVEANLHLSYIIPLLIEVFPGCKIIRIVRDGRVFVRSAYSKKRKTADGKYYSFMDSNDPRKRLEPKDLSDIKYSDIWDSMSRFERICWHWVTLDSLILQSIEEYPHAMSLKYEELFNPDNGFSKLNQLLDFINMKNRIHISDEELRQLLTRKKDSTAEYILPHWREWPSDLTRHFNAIAGEHMRKCGYE